MLVKAKAWAITAFNKWNSIYTLTWVLLRYVEFCYPSLSVKGTGFGHHLILDCHKLCHATHLFFNKLTLLTDSVLLSHNCSLLTSTFLISVILQSTERGERFFYVQIVQMPYHLISRCRVSKTVSEGHCIATLMQDKAVKGPPSEEGNMYIFLQILMQN